jgi:hypothetical protein
MLVRSDNTASSLQASYLDLIEGAAARLAVNAIRMPIHNLDHIERDRSWTPWNSDLDQSELMR